MTEVRTRATYLRLAIVVGWVLISLTAIVAGYRSTSPVLAWQMFPEASTIDVSVVRVTGDGRHVDVAERWPGGYRWDELVAARGLDALGGERDASYGVAPSLEALQHALDWVAEHTPRDGETVWLEAAVTYRHNADPPQRVVLRSVVREMAP